MKISTGYGIVPILLLCLSFSQTKGQTNSSVHDGVIRLKVVPELVPDGSDLIITKNSKGIVSTGFPSLDRLCQQYAASSIQRVFPFNQRLEAKHQAYGLHLWYELKFSSVEDAKKVASAYASLQEVSYAEPMYKTKLITGTFTPVESATTQATSALPFNDPYLSKQWHYHNTGDYDGLVGSDINLFEAWKVTTGTPNVVVSVHDQGVDYTHEDLASNMWKNMAEFNGQPNVDDDNNGYVDDIYGYNFSDHTGTITKMEHGTHVSGTIAAVTNNGKGVSGVAGGSGHGDGVRIMSCQILGGQGSSNPESYIYAADNGALISQNSWGYVYPGDYEQATLNAIDYFIAEAGKFPGSPMKGGVVIFAAGNDGTDESSYPGFYPSVVAVSSLGPKSVRAYYSNYGSWVDISSYGGDDSMHPQNQVLSTVPNNGYAYMEGTSMATPHVSGIAALILSKHGGPDFTNKMLLNQLLTGVRNVYEFNPEMTGLLGVGISDAALAVASDNHLAPLQISDLTLTGISQDFATLQWSVPSDPDDTTPSQFILYYSTDSIADSNLSSANMIAVKNNFTAGITIPLEVDGLLSTTHYYFMVQSVDRWGNTSVFSNEVNGTTNQGPSIALNKTHLDLTVDILMDSVTADSLRIFDKDAGILKWSSVFRHKNVTLPFKNPGLHYPTLQTQSVSPNLTLAKQRVPTRVAGIPIDGNDFTTIQKEYYDPYGAAYVIGDEDLSLTNSSATKFTVTEATGFNFTQVQAFLAHDNNTGPMILEVYLGASLSSATLTYAQEVTSDFSDPYWHYVELNEEIFLESGTTFWVVFHVPAHNKYPLGMGMELNNNDSENCLYSSNLGKSWVKLSSVISDNRWVFTVAALSERSNIGNYIGFNPVSGQVLSGDSSRVVISAIGTKLKNGIYSADAVISTNDKVNPLVKLPITLEVKNHPALLQVTDIIDFSSVFLGSNKTMDVTVTNAGYGDFSPLSISISDPQFTLINSVPAKIAARYSEILTFQYQPANPASANATVTLSDGAGNHHLFYLNGVGASPPLISLSPSTINVTNLTLGNVFTSTINIQNKGDYPLRYAFPRFADDNTLGELGSTIQKFGYSYKANLGGTPIEPAYNFQEISTTEPNVLDQLVRNDFYELDLGFNFPFYGKFYSKIYITKLGAVTFANDGVLNGSSGRIGEPSFPSGYITASWNYFDPKAGGGIYFKQLPGKTIVEYKNIALNDPFLGLLPSTFQIILYQNGDAEIVYEDVSSWDPFDLSYFVVGMDDPQHKDGLTISDVINPIGITSHSIIHIYNPGVGALQSVSSASGTVPVGGTQAVDMTFSTKDLYQGSFSELVHVVSNDRMNNPALTTINFSINNGGKTQLVVDQSPINFGKVFKTGSKKSLFSIKNEGTADVQINTMNFQGNAFSLDHVAPIILGGTQSAYVNIILTTANQGTFVDTLTIVSNGGDIFKIPLRAEVVPQPIISVDVASINKTLASGDSTRVVLMVSNQGKGDLEIVSKGTDWLYAPVANSGLNNTYSWSTSRDAGGPTYNWVDIVQDSNRLDSLDVSSTNHFWQAVKLPFTFTYFGKAYDSLYVGANGIVSFKGHQGNFLFVDSDIPLASGLNNYIAPLWLPGAPDAYNYPDAGVYYQAFADKIVVTYNKFNNIFGMGNSISFEVILYNSGNIEFQYDLGSFDLSSQLGMSGLENIDGSAGILIANREHLLRDKMAIFLVPTSSLIVPAKSSIPIQTIVDARYLYAGNYTANFVIQNNSPANPHLEIPATLAVTGLPGLVYPDSIVFGESMAYLVADNSGIMGEKVYYQYFDFLNNGRDNTVINKLQLQNGSPELGIEMQFVDPSFGYIYWADATTLVPLFIAPGNKLKMRVTLTPQPSNHLVADSISVSSGARNFTIPVNASIVLPPVLALNTDQLTVQANTNAYQETKEFIIDNKAGGTTLNYSLSLVYYRSKPQTTSASVAPAKSNNANSARQVPANASLQAASLGKTTANNSSRGIQVESFSQYNRVLQYDTLQAASARLGFNGSFEMLSGITFTAPETGFNLSTVITWYAPGEWLSSDLVVEIRGGSDDIRQSQLIYTQLFNYTIASSDDIGKFIEIPLDEPQLFYPSEKFFVVVKYPLGTTHPQGTAMLTENLTNTFFFSTGDGNWFDLTTGGFPSHGWMIKAAEKQAVPAGWATLGNTKGSIAAGQQQSVSVLFNSDFAQDPDNYAKVNIASNDPITIGKSELLLLHKNQAPAFTDGGTIRMTVLENDTLLYQLSAVDPEHDSFSFSLASPYSRVSLKSLNDTTIFSMITDYDMAGNYEFDLLARDAYNNVSTQKLLITVINVNRAPIVINPLTTRNYFRGDDEERIDLDRVFEDPDGDAMTFASISSNTKVINVFSSGSQIILSPESEGDGTITIAASDSYGSKDTLTFSVHVSAITGVEPSNPVFNVVLFPNPTKGKILIHLSGEPASNYSVSVTSIMGIAIMRLSNISQQIHDVELDLNDVSTGIYIVEVNDHSGKTIKRIVKN